MKLTIALLGTALIILIGIMGTQSNNIKELQSEVRRLNAKLADDSKADEAQRRCAAQAGKVFDAARYPKSDFAAFTSHYAAKLDKCMIRVLHTDAQSAQGKMIWLYVNVLDASDGRQYGTYTWHTLTSRKFLIVPPATCEVTLPTGEQKTCHSVDEFEGLVKVYTEE